MHVTTVCSLVYLFSGSTVCLPRSLSGPTRGKRSGYGGKQEPGETIHECAVRETFEESGGIRLLELDKRGVVTFHWGSKQDVPGLRVERCSDVEVHIYRCDMWDGIPIATEAFEDPSFYPVAAIPYGEMMPCEELWFAQLLAGNTFTAEMHFRKCNGKVYCREGHLHKRARTDLYTKP